jgi:hypothetical protein
MLVCLSFNSVVFQPQFEIKTLPVGQSVTRVCFSCLLVLVNIFLCEVIFCIALIRKSSSYLLFCWSVPVFHRHFVSDDKSAYLGMLPTIKVSTVICIGSCFCTLLRYKRICLHFGHFSTASLFSVYHPHVGTAAFIHKCYFIGRSLLKVLSLLWFFWNPCQCP